MSSVGFSGAVAPSGLARADGGVPGGSRGSVPGADSAMNLRLGDHKSHTWEDVKVKRRSRPAVINKMLVLEYVQK